MQEEVWEASTSKGWRVFFFCLFTGRKIPLTALGFNGDDFLLPKCWPKGREGGRREETHPHNSAELSEDFKKGFQPVPGT